MVAKRAFDAVFQETVGRVALEVFQPLNVLRPGDD